MTFKHKLSRRLALLFSAAAVGAMAVGSCEKPTKLTSPPVGVAEMVIAPQIATVQAGQTLQLTATPKDANGNPLSGRVVTWSSSNTAAATVNGSGRVTGVAAGSATITATSEGHNGTAAVTVVTAPPAPTCQTSSLTMVNTAFAAQTGSFTVQFDATPNSAPIDAVTGLSQGAAAGYADLAVLVRFSDVGTIDARNGSVYAAASAIPYTAGTSYHFRLVVDVAAHTFSAYVTPAGGTEATIGTNYAFRTEQSAVTALANWALRAGTGSHTVCDFTLGAGTPPAPVATVTVTPPAATVDAGNTVQLTATLKDANGNPLSGRVVTWTSDNTTAATVSSSGLVSGVAAGSATITATSEGQSGTAAITVTTAPPPAPVASVTVTPAPASVNEGKTVQLAATLRDAAGNVLTGRTVTWTSDNTTVATVSSSGLVTGKVAGTATITATSEGQSGTAAVTVVHPPVASVTVAPPAASIQQGQNVQLTATPKDATGSPLSGRVVTWSSDNTAAATVSASGLVAGVAAGSATITASSEGQSGTSAITVTAPPPPGSSYVFVGAGDIAGSQNNDEATAKLLDVIPGTVYTLGDNVYTCGSPSEYATYYDPTWGRHKARTKPAPGNHDYCTSGAAGYFGYFGALAGDPTKGYYSSDLGDWHLISLNSNVSMSAGSAQEQWLRADLAASTKTCTIAYWHHPRFSSGASHGSDARSAAIWQALYDFGAEIVLSGHDHEYERFAPQTPGAVLDLARGIREFVVGTGGESHYNFTTPVANSEVRDNTSFGVLKLTLSPGAYTWEFVPVAGASFRDSGSGTCH